MRFSTMGMILSLSIFGILCWGCAAKNTQQNISKMIEYRKMMDRQKAEIAQREEASRKIPDMTAEGYEKLGDNYLSQGSLDMAFLQYGKALQLDPGQARIHYKMGRLFLEKGLGEEAKNEFQKVLKAKPDDGLAYEGLGRVYFNARNYSEAEKNFKQAIKLNPDLWQAHNFLGLIYDRQGQFETAITHYKTAIVAQTGRADPFE